MIARKLHERVLLDALRRAPVAALLGPRQCGKTTLARQVASGGDSHYLDLESPADQRRLEDAEFYLGGLDGLIVLDEIQIRPDLFNVLRVLVDRDKDRRRFLILGSASPDVVKGVSQSLAGRVEFVELSGFDLEEVGTGRADTLWLRGGFPRSFLAADEEDSGAWREAFLRTFLERDLPQLGITVPAPAMRRFWTMLAHSHGQLWNASRLARSMSLSDKTVRGYLDLLTGTFMVRQLQPWFENLGKRQVKSPKIYLRDSGLLHRLLEIGSRHELLGHPQLGASWEGFALEQVLATIRPAEAYFWATKGGAELDLMFMRGGRKYGIEFKHSTAPGTTRSMQVALDDLDLEHLWIVTPGAETADIRDRISVVGIEALEAVRERVTNPG